MTGMVYTLWQWSLAGQAKWLTVDVLEAIQQTDLVGKACLLVLALFSVVSWAIIGYKFLHIRQGSQQSDAFINGCMSSAESLEQAYRGCGEYPDSPLAQILKETYLEMEIENWYQDYPEMAQEDRLALSKVGIERVMERTVSNEIRQLESYLMFLATTASVCPFIGLFGTVWGILGCFQSVAHQGTMALSTLAPGISTALSTTVAGLAAAIPAAVAYNYLANRIQVLVRRMDSFALELSNIVQKQILKRGVS